METKDYPTVVSDNDKHDEQHDRENRSVIKHNLPYALRLGRREIGERRM